MFDIAPKINETGFIIYFDSFILSTHLVCITIFHAMIISLFEKLLVLDAYFKVGYTQLGIPGKLYFRSSGEFEKPKRDD